jgi:hypothetical protein
MIGKLNFSSAPGSMRTDKIKKTLLPTASDQKLKHTVETLGYGFQESSHWTGVLVCYRLSPKLGCNRQITAIHQSPAVQKINWDDAGEMARTSWAIS